LAPDVASLIVRSSAADPLTQAEVQALRDKSAELADGVRALSTLVHALRERSSHWGW